MHIIIEKNGDIVCWIGKGGTGGGNEPNYIY